MIFSSPETWIVYQKAMGYGLHNPKQSGRLFFCLVDLSEARPLPNGSRG